MNLSKDVFERRTSTGSGLFLFWDSGFAHFLGQLVSIIVKTRRNTNLGASRCFKMKKTSLPVDVRRSKTPLLKLPMISNILRSRVKYFSALEERILISARLWNIIYISGQHGSFRRLALFHEENFNEKHAAYVRIYRSVKGWTESTLADNGAFDAYSRGSAFYPPGCDWARPH